MNSANAAANRFLAALREYGIDPTARPVRGDRLCAACVRALPIEEAALAVAMPDGRWEVLGAAGTTAELFAEAQAATGEGPGPDAHRGGVPVRVRHFHETLATGRWPLLGQWSHDAVDAMTSFPLRLGAIRVGFLDLLGVENRSLTVTEYIDAMNIADLITTLLLTSLARPHGATGLDGDGSSDAAPENNGVTAVGGVTAVDGVALGPWWEQSLATREIHQATGMVAVQMDCAAAEAYSHLVGHAFSTGRGLGEIAADVVARRLRFPTDGYEDREPDPGPEPTSVRGP